MCKMLPNNMFGPVLVIMNFIMNDSLDTEECSCNKGADLHNCYHQFRVLGLGADTGMDETVEADVLARWGVWDMTMEFIMNDGISA
jgi:hypothetical protein